MGLSLNKVLDSKITGLLVFGVTGSAKMVSDYKKAPDAEKDIVLTRDSLILGGTALAVGAYELSKGKIINNTFLKNKLSVFSNKVKNNKVSATIKNGINHIPDKITKSTAKVITTTGNIIKDCIDNTLMLGFGILGAIGADYAIRYSHIEKNKRLRKLNRLTDNTFNTIYNYEDRIKNNLKNSRINHDIDDKLGSELKSNIYSRVTDLHAMRMFSTTMVGVQGFEVIEEKTFKKRMKHATSCIISNSIIPLFFLSMGTRLTKGLHSVVRAPIIFTSLVGGTMYANKLINNMNKGKGILHKLTTKKEVQPSETQDENV